MVGLSLIESVPILFLIPAAWTDFRSGRIPNCVSLTLLASGILLAALRGGLSFALTGAAVAFAFFAFLPGLTSGGGDLKLAAACGAWLGPERAAYFCCFTAAILALAAVVNLVRKDGLKGLWRRLCLEVKELRLLGRTVEPLDPVPGAPAMLAAYALVAIGLMS